VWQAFHRGAQQRLVGGLAVDLGGQSRVRRRMHGAHVQQLSQLKHAHLVCSGCTHMHGCMQHAPPVKVACTCMADPRRCAAGGARRIAHMQCSCSRPCLPCPAMSCRVMAQSAQHANDAQHCQVSTTVWPAVTIADCGCRMQHVPQRVCWRPCRRTVCNWRDMLRTRRRVVCATTASSSRKGALGRSGSRCLGAAWIQ